MVPPRRIELPTPPLPKMVLLSIMRNIKYLLAFWINELPTMSIKCKNKSSIFRVVGSSPNKDIIK